MANHSDVADPVKDLLQERAAHDDGFTHATVQDVPAEKTEDWDAVTPQRLPSASESIYNRKKEEEDIDIHPDNEARVAALARQISSTMSARRLSRVATNYDDIEGQNPFTGSDNPRLQPGNDQFNPKAWMRSLMAIRSRDPERFPNRTAGITFKNLSAHGYGTATDYQKDVANIWIEAGSTIKSLLGMGKKRKIQILKDFDGLVRSGEMLVVLGRPGSGCTTLLKTIGGDTYGFHLSQETELHYQGIPSEMMHKNFRGEVIYQAETDVHFPNLTVGQTLEFAALARAPHNRMGDVSREEYAIHMRDVVMAMYGLTHTLNTKVGNDFVRGVSGGERKRVSISEVALAGAPVQCWDNSTRGLDSATSLEFIRSLRLNAKSSGSTAVVAIYQASQSAYDLFDKVILLYEGREIYFGPCQEAKEYFLDLGFECAERATTGDFLTSLTNPSERIIKAGWENKTPRTADEFAAIWKESQTRQTLLQEIEEYEKEYPVGGNYVDEFRKTRQTVQAKHISSKSPYTISYPMQVKLCMKRGFQRLRGDMSITLSGVIGNSVMALIVSSVFYNLEDNTGSFFSRGALLFFAILLNGFASALEILTLYAQRPIVEKHDKYALYKPSAEAVSSMICDLPAKITVAIVFNLIIYFMTNLNRTPAAFFTFLLFSFTCTLTMSMIFRTIGACSRTLAGALAPAALFILMLVMYTGFAIPTVDMVVWFRWLNYLNPIAYAFESLMVNEFHGRKFPCSAYTPSGPGYENISGLQRTCQVVGGVAGSNYVDGDAYINTAFAYYEIHKWRNLGILFAFVVAFCAAYIIASDYITAAKSKGEVLVFRRGHGHHAAAVARTSADDAEAANPGTAAREAELGAALTHEKSVAAIQRQTAIFHWKDVTYDIKIKGGERRLLDHVDGWVKPGTLTALMGVSGAGKTTLLDVLASRVTMGVVTGDMFVNGAVRDNSFQRKTGYVQQQDLHLATSTVREALNFSALLRQPRELSRAEKLEYVEEVIKVLDMTEYADAVVGVPGEGLNVEQRKRLTIGVEMAAKPELLLFLDEPTSGLDSQTAWSICTLLRKLAHNGQAILCTIHQPSAILFQEFDRLLFLAKGGRTVYYGPVGHGARTLIKYFEDNCGHPCPEDANPAEWMLECIGAAPGAHSDQDWPQLWNDSPERQQVRKELDEMEEELPTTAEELPMAKLASSDKEFAAPFMQQLGQVFRRVAQQYWRTPEYIYAKLFLVTSSSLFVGFSFWQAGTSQQGLQNQLFSIFLLLTIFGNLTQQIMPHFVTQRSLYEARERPSKTYSWQSFMLSNILVELPWQTLAAVISFFAFYYPIGLNKNTYLDGATTERGALFFLFTLGFYLFTSTFSHMIIAACETAENGGNIANLMFSLCLIFCGVLASPGQLPGFWIFMYRVSPFTYLVSGLLSTGVANNVVVCKAIELVKVEPPSGKTCFEYLTAYTNVTGGNIINPQATSGCEICSIGSTNTFLAAVNISYSDRWRNFGILMVYIVFNVFGAIALYWLTRVPKKAKRGEKVEKSSKVAQQAEAQGPPEEK